MHDSEHRRSDFSGVAQAGAVERALGGDITKPPSSQGRMPA